MRTGFLNCTIVPGMFKDELGVIISFGDNIEATSFVDRANIIFQEGNGGTLGKLRVMVKDKVEGGILVYLPAETSTGQRSLIVNPKYLEYSTG